MTSSLNPGEIASESDATGDREVTVAFRISEEAIGRLAHRVTERSMMQSQILLLACGLQTLLEELRDEQHRFTVAPKLPDGAPNVPAIGRHADLRNAGRCAATAMTQLESAVHWARQARHYVG